MARITKCDRCTVEIPDTSPGDHHVLKVYTVPSGDAVLKSDLCSSCVKILTEEFLLHKE